MNADLPVVLHSTGFPRGGARPRRSLRPVVRSSTSNSNPVKGSTASALKWRRPDTIDPEVLIAMLALSNDQVTSFIRDGFVRVSQAFPSEVAEQCRAILWRKTGLDPEDPGTWTEPVVRIGGCAEEPFVRAANTTTLHGAYDQLVGTGRWSAPQGLGTFPIRFPHRDDPGDDGWHLDASYAGSQGEVRVNLRSRDRALLMLFLFSDVSPDDAPTRIRIGSHRDVPPLLEASGDDGREWMELCQEAVPASEHRPETLATGRAGDVYLCHPFLVHGAQPHHGTAVRFIAQPPLEPTGPLDLDRTDGTYSPVEVAVRHSLGHDTAVT